MFGTKFDPEKVAEPRRKSAEGEHWIKRMKKGAESQVIRPLAEPTEWVTYLECYDKHLRRSWPVTDDFLAEEHQEVRRRHLAPVLDVESDRVWALQLPADIAEALSTRYNRTGTVMDRDYIMLRSGSGLETSYKVDWDDPTPRDLSKYDRLDLEQVLEDAARNAVEQGWTGSGAAPQEAPERPQERPAEAPPQPPQAEEKSPEADVSTEEEPVAGRSTMFTDEELGSFTLSKLRSIARDRGVNPSGLSKTELIEALAEDAF